jgi:hypothetical protein
LGTFLDSEKKVRPAHDGGRAEAWPDLFATALSAARRERPHAAAMHLSAAISADVQACSERRANAKNGKARLFHF